MQKQIDYVSIFKDAWKLVWNNRFMWILGFFMMLGGGLSGISFDEKQLDYGKVHGPLNYLQEHLILAFSLIFLAVIISLSLYVLALLSRVAVIKGTTETAIYSQLKLGKILSNSWNFFWRMLLLDLIFFLALFGVVISLVLPVVILFSIKAFVAGFLMSFIALVILLPILVGAYFVKKFAGLGIVMADLKIRHSIESGYTALVTNGKKSIIMGLLMVAISCLIFVAIIAIIITVVVQGMVAGTIGYSLFGIWGIVPVAVILLGVMIASLIFAASLIQSWTVVVWTLFFQEISAVKLEEKVGEIETIDEVAESIQPEAV